MDAAFWQQRWRNGHTGWMQKRINPRLQEWLPRLLADGVRDIFVPLCGNSLDMTWLAGRDLRVHGVERVEDALADFFQREGLQPDLREEGKGRLWTAGAYALWQADILQLSAEQLPPSYAVYDRAALLALPEPMRRRYAAWFGRVCPPGTRLLLLCAEYDPGEMQGPPFPVFRQEVEEIYGAQWTIDLLCHEEVPLAQRWKERGMTGIREAVYLLQHT